MGQGNETAFAQIVSDRLGVPPERIQVFAGDSDALGAGRGNGGSGALTVGGSAVVRATDKIIERGRRIAAHLLEAAFEDVVFRDGRFTVAGHRQGRGLRGRGARRLPAAPASRGDGAGLQRDGGLHAARRHIPQRHARCARSRSTRRPASCGSCATPSWTTSATWSTPCWCKGQIHGGIVQGLGQGLFEVLAYEPRPAAPHRRPSWTTRCRAPTTCRASTWTTTRSRPRSIRSAPRAWERPARSARCPALLNAVNDALAPLGVRHLDMPVTPERVWRAIQEAKAAR